jgi:hypothetical protein
MDNRQATKIHDLLRTDTMAHFTRVQHELLSDLFGFREARNCFVESMLIFVDACQVDVHSGSARSAFGEVSLGDSECFLDVSLGIFPLSLQTPT